jgi:hypothetical protein
VGESEKLRLPRHSSLEFSSSQIASAERRLLVQDKSTRIVWRKKKTQNEIRLQADLDTASSRWLQMLSLTGLSASNKLCFRSTMQLQIALNLLFVAKLCLRHLPTKGNISRELSKPEETIAPALMIFPSLVPSWGPFFPASNPAHSFCLAKGVRFV